MEPQLHIYQTKNFIVANRYEKGTNTGVNITINGLTVREESDINKIASQLLKKINENKIVYGGAY